MSTHNGDSRPDRSPTTRHVMVGIRTIRRVLQGEIVCPLCSAGDGVVLEHARGCLVLEALTHDPLFQREATKVRRG